MKARKGMGEKGATVVIRATVVPTVKLCCQVKEGRKGGEGMGKRKQ